MTPDAVRAAIAGCQSWAQGDPEAWHSHVDKVRRDVLREIAGGHPDAAALAEAVLEADAVPTAWHACA